MPRDGSGTYTYPSGTRGAPATPIESLKYNNYIDDVAIDLNTPRPITAGGTGGTTVNDTLDNLSAEKFKQVVTNWDTTVWRAGSFYAASGALGTVPVTGHAFAGICYFANATDFVCEATDLTDPVNPVQYIRIMVAGVWSAWTRLGAGSAAANLGEYTFDSTITFPPASGQIRFNNATQNSTTEIFISHIGALGGDNTGLIPFTIKSGSDIIIQDKDEGPKYKLFSATADPVLSGGDFRVTVTYKSGGTDLVSAQRMLIGGSTGGTVLYNTAQTLTSAQQVQARQNIYAAPFDALAYNGIQINGGIDVSQENGAVGVVVPSSGVPKYIVDGWSVQSVGVQALSAWKLPSGTYQAPLGYNASLQIDITTSNASPAISDCCFFTHKIEGYRAGRLNYGGTLAQPVTVGFWVLANRPGSYSGSLGNGIINNRSYVFVFTVNATNTWEYKTVTIPGDTAGTWVNDNTTAMQLCITMMAGPNLCTTPGSWANGSFIGATGTINGVANAATDTMLLTGVFILPGVEAPPAERAPYIMRPYDQELVTCQRYWEKITVPVWQPGFAGTPIIPIAYKATKRSNPTVATVGTISGIGASAHAISLPNTQFTGIQATFNSTTAYIQDWNISVDARL